MNQGMRKFLLFFRPILMSVTVWLGFCLGIFVNHADAAAADMRKTLHVAWRAAETGFDPAQVSDVFSNDIIRAILDPLLTYDYLARPAQAGAPM